MKKVKKPIEDIIPKKRKFDAANLKIAGDYVRDLLTSGPQGAVGKGVEMGVGAMLARTVLRRLPVPMNFVVPLLAEKVIMKHGVETGRDILLKGLRWVKDKTEDKQMEPAVAIGQF